MFLSCTVSKIQREIGRKSPLLTYPPLSRCLASENYSLWAIVWRYFCDPMFSRFGRVPACDRRTDGHKTTYTALT